MDNNIICKIQNLDHLVNLNWLDLSFNLIEQIEGLDKLTKLTDLSLYSNKIKKLSGLENLSNLNVLSFGKNCIVKYDDDDGCINYLRGLKNKLEVLKMAENKFTSSG
jgi:Leucine-rich repeat (LRR) protein